MLKAIGIISTNYRLNAIERLSENRPLSSVPFGCRYRLIDFALSNMVNAGIRSVGVLLPYRMRPLLDHLAAGKAWNLDRHSGGLFMLPSVTPALKPRVQMFCVRDILANIEFLTVEEADVVIITASNYVVNMNYAKILKKHEKKGADITLVYKNGLKFNSKVESKLELDKSGKVSGIRRTEDQDTSDMESTFADVFVFNRQLLIDMISSSRDTEFKDLLDLVESTLQDKVVLGHEYKDYIKQIFTLQDYYETSMELMTPEIKCDLFDWEEKIITKIKDSPPTKYKEHAVIKNSYVAGGCILDGKVTNSLLFRKVTVGKNSHLKGCIVMHNCDIGENSILENVILDKGIKIPANTVLKAQADSPMYLPKGVVV